MFRKEPHGQLYVSKLQSNIYTRYVKSVASQILVVVCLIVRGVLVLIKIYKNRHFLFKR